MSLPRQSPVRHCLSLTQALQLPHSPEPAERILEKTPLASKGSSVIDNSELVNNTQVIPWQRLNWRVEIKMRKDREGNIDIFISNISNQLKEMRGLQGVI